MTVGQHDTNTDWEITDVEDDGAEMMDVMVMENEHSLYGN